MENIVLMTIILLEFLFVTLPLTAQQSGEDLFKNKYTTITIKTHTATNDGLGGMTTNENQNANLQVENDDNADIQSDDQDDQTSQGDDDDSNDSPAKDHQNKGGRP